MSAPLVVDRQHSGAVNCYSLDQHGFVELDEQLLHLYVTATTIALRGLRQAEQARAVELLWRHGR